MSDATVLAGDLEFLGLGELLQLLGSNGCTGELRLISKYSHETGRIYIAKGNPVNASNGTLSGFDAVASLFGWTAGKFEFDSGAVTCDKVIQKSRMSIILDCLSLLDEGEIERLGPVSYTQKLEVKRPADEIPLPTIKGPLVDYMYVVDEEEFTDGQQVAVEGKHGNWIWVILEGTIEIEKRLSRTGRAAKLLRLGEGAFLGSTASFKIGGNVRSASAIASGDVLLGVLDAQRLAGEFTKLSVPFRGVVDGLDRRLREVSKHATEIYFNRNTVKKMLKDTKPVMTQGDTEDKVFAVSSGSVRIVRRAKHGYVPLATLEKGDVFGRIPFLDVGHEPDAAAVFGSKDLKVKSLDAKALQKEFEGLSPIFRNLLEHMAVSITVTTRRACDFHRKNQSGRG